MQWVRMIKRFTSELHSWFDLKCWSKLICCAQNRLRTDYWVNFFLLCTSKIVRENIHTSHLLWFWKIFVIFDSDRQAPYFLSIFWSFFFFLFYFQTLESFYSRIASVFLSAACSPMCLWKNKYALRDILHIEILQNIHYLRCKQMSLTSC